MSRKRKTKQIIQLELAELLAPNFTRCSDYNKEVFWAWAERLLLGVEQIKRSYPDSEKIVEHIREHKNRFRK